MSLKKIHIIILPIFALILITGYVCIFKYNVLYRNSIATQEMSIDNYSMYQITDDLYINQTFTPSTYYINSINVFLIGIEEDDPGYLQYRILNAREDEVYSERIPLADITPGQWTEFSFLHPVYVSKGKPYQIVFEAHDYIEAPYFFVLPFSETNEQINELVVNDEPVTGQLSISFGYIAEYTLYMKCFLLLTLLLVLIIAYTSYINKNASSLIPAGLRKWSYHLVCLILIGWIAWLHFHNFATVPGVLQVDEMATSYDAYCLANFGVDRHLVSYPIYLENYGKGASILSVYIAAIFMKVFGFNILTIKIPAIISSILTLLFGYKIIKLCYSNNKIVNLTFLLLYGLTPYFNFVSRYALDCNIMLGTSTAFLYFFMKAQTSKKNKDYVLAGIIGGLVLYSYCLSWVVMPLFIIFSIGYLIYTQKICISNILAFGITIFILAIPLLLFQYVNIFNAPDIHIGSITIGKISEYRGSNFSFQHFFKNMLNGIKNTIAYDDISDIQYYQYGTLFMISIPFIIVGAFSLIKKSFTYIHHKSETPIVFVFCWMCSMLILSGLLDGAGTSRLNSMFFILLFLLIEGLFISISFIKKKEVQVLLILALSVIYSHSHVKWCGYYFADYAKDYEHKVLNYGYMKPLTDYIDNEVSPEIAARDTYFYCNLGEGSCFAEYYYAAKQMSPYNINIDNGGDERYQNMIFHDNEDNYQEDCNYVIPYSNAGYLNELKLRGFTIIELDKYYYCFYE